MVFGSTASASSWEPFRRAIEALSVLYLNRPVLVKKHRKYLDMLSWATDDGMPDIWEILHFGNTASTAQADADLDGQSNIEEYQAGLDPQQNEFNNTAKHTAFQYDPVGRLEQVSSPTASENIVPDDEGNITTAN